MVRRSHSHLGTTSRHQLTEHAFFGSGEEAGVPGKITYTGRTCKLHTERPQLGIVPGTLLLCGDGANDYTFKLQTKSSNLRKQDLLSQREINDVQQRFYGRREPGRQVEGHTLSSPPENGYQAPSENPDSH